MWETRKLPNGVSMPIEGFGVFQIPERDCEQVVMDAIDAGYRLIDTASSYQNEEAVGRAVRNCGVPRDELFITTKAYIQEMGYDNTMQAFERSLDKLGLDYLDLYLIPHMIDIQVDVIHSQVLKAFIYHPFDMLLPRDPLLDLFVCPRQEFCCDYDLIPLCEIRQRPAKILLAGTVLVAYRRIEKVYPCFDPPFYYLSRMFLIYRPAVLPPGCVPESHTSHTYPRNIQFRITQLRVLHFLPPFQIFPPDFPAEDYTALRRSGSDPVHH